MMLTLPADVLDPAVAIAPAMPGHPQSRAQAVRSFESLFLETLLTQAGLGQALDPGGELGGGAAGELMVRELARDLARQLPLGFDQLLGLSTKEEAIR